MHEDNRLESAPTVFGDQAPNEQNLIPNDTNEQILAQNGEFLNQVDAIMKTSTPNNTVV